MVAFGWLVAATFCFSLGAEAPTEASVDQDDAAQLGPGVAARDPRIPPRKRKKLLNWLNAGSYLNLYTAEPEVHDSLGPHGGKVRTYYNPILVDDLRAGRTVWSKGAAMVKELYTSDASAVRGYAVMIKVTAESGQNGEGWLFYETFDVTGGGSPYYGRGLRVCASCHDGGVDFLLSEFRPEQRSIRRPRSE
jgi:hypothetical protein